MILSVAHCPLQPIQVQSCVPVACIIMLSFANVNLSLSCVYTVGKIPLSWWVLKNRKKYFAFLKPTSLAQFQSWYKGTFTDEEKTFITSPTYFHVTILLSLSLMYWKNKLCFFCPQRNFSAQSNISLAPLQGLCYKTLRIHNLQ